MKKRIVMAVLAAALGTALLAGCGGGQKAESTGETLTVFNYGEYMDPKMIQQFEDETGIEVKYEEAVTPEEMYSKYSSGVIDYDLLCTSDYMLKKLIDEGSVQPVDFDSFEYGGNIGDDYWNFAKSFDEENQYVLPYFLGTIGILYDTTKVNETPDSWDVLFNGEYAGQFIMQDSMRDSFMITLKSLGYSLNTDNEQEIRQAQQRMLKQKPDVQAYLVDEARDEVVAGNATMAVVYSGEAYLGHEYNPDVEYVVPKEGTNIWMDGWVITKECQNTEAAQKFLDFLCREDVAEANFEYIYYSTPNQAVIDNMDEDMRNNEAILPDISKLKNSEVCTQSDPAITELYNELWKEIKAE